MAAWPSPFIYFGGIANGEYFDNGFKIDDEEISEFLLAKGAACVGQVVKINRFMYAGMED